MAGATTIFRLTDLPEELVSTVASHVSSSRDLSLLALASKQLNRITKPHLYRHISLFLGPEYRHYELFFSLVILLLKRPQLAAYVQHLTIRGEWRRAWNAGRGCRINDLHPVLRGAIDQLTADRKSKRAWADNTMGWDREEALFAVVLHALPNLETLDTTVKDMPGMHYRWLMRQISSHPKRLLGKLRNLVLVFIGAAPYEEAQMCQPWFHLPSLKRVSLYEPNGRDEIPGQNQVAEITQYLEKAVSRRAKITTDLSAVEHLDVREDFHNFRPLCDYITSCGALRTFSYSYAHESEHLDDTILFELLMLALAVHASTLTTLSVSQPTASDGLIAYTDFPPLKQFSSLQHLKLPVQYLFPLGVYNVADTPTEVIASGMAEKLPPGLPRLSILLDKSPEFLIYCQSAIAFLLENQPEMLPGLEELSVFCHRGAATGEILVQILRAPAIKHGIRLRIFDQLDVGSAEDERCPEWEGIGGDVEWAPTASYKEVVPMG